jgi:4,5-dihydroxyphthalate decarboxylase
MYVRKDANVEGVTDLEGRRVGIVNWQTTTGIWQRGILGEHHGLDTTAVQWVSGGDEIVEIDVPSEYDVEYVGHQGSTIGVLEEMIADGEIDAIFHPVDSSVDNAERLFEDAKSVEQDYYRKTSIFPVMHAIVLKDSLIEEEPWVLQKLFDAFEEAKTIGLQALDRPRELPLVWADIHADEQEEVLGEDPWEYGLTEDNVTTVETLARYAHEQGVAAERYDIEELFALDTLDTDYYA